MDKQNELKSEFLKGINELENPYPKDVFPWESKDDKIINNGVFNKFIFDVYENARQDFIKLVKEMLDNEEVK